MYLLNLVKHYQKSFKVVNNNTKVVNIIQEIYKEFRNIKRYSQIQYALNNIKHQ